MSTDTFMTCFIIFQSAVCLSAIIGIVLHWMGKEELSKKFCKPFIIYVKCLFTLFLLCLVIDFVLNLFK